MYCIHLWRHYLYVQVENICTVFNNICLLKTTKVRIELLERELFQFLFTISDSDFKTQLFNLQVFSLCGSIFVTSIKTPIQFTKLHTITNAPYFLLSMNSIYFSFLSCWSSIQSMNTLINSKSCKENITGIQKPCPFLTFFGCCYFLVKYVHSVVATQPYILNILMLTCRYTIT